MLNFGPGNSLTQSLHKCPAQKLTWSLHSTLVVRLFFEAGITAHYAEALAGVNDGAKVEVKELTERKQKNLAFIAISGDESVRPKVEHKEGRGSPNRNSKIDNELQHFLKSPFLLYIYNTIFDC